MLEQHRIILSRPKGRDYGREKKGNSVRMIYKSEIFIDKEINRTAVTDFMKKAKERKNDIHSFEVIHGGKTVVRVAARPYSFDFKQQLYSLSKSFTSTAIGFLYDDGIIDTEDRLIDIFADKCPEKISENLAKMRVKHVLSMNTGHDRCTLPIIRNEYDPVRSFLALDVKFEPGTHFCYNSGATYMLSELVGKYTGMSMFDFLNERLFGRLGIEGVHWDCFPDRNSQGGVGLYASSEDVAKLGVLYLNRGKFGGEQILSEEWTEMATRSWSDNSDNGTPDWTAGYGFQFWRNAREGFRGDGAFGQLCVVLPERGTVIAVQAISADMQSEMDLVSELADSLFKDGGSMTDAELAAFADGYNAPCKYEGADVDIFEKRFRCNENKFGIPFAEFSEDKDSVSLKFSDGTQWQKMTFGKGDFCENSVVIKKFKPVLEELMGHDGKERVHFASYCTFCGGALHMYINFLDNPHVEEYVCKLENDGFSMTRQGDDEPCLTGKIND